jgi:UDP-glucose:(heptosyl)LPS alpha-1,3-glucosyltransferase
MKIAMICIDFNKTGGIERYTAELAQRFAVNNEVHVYSATVNGIENDKITFHKIPILSFNALVKAKKHAINSIFTILSFISYMLFLKEINNFDIVHSQGAYIGKIDIYTMHSCHKASLVVARKENFIEKVKKSAINPLHFIILRLQKYSLFHAKRLVAISETIKEEVLKYYNLDVNKIRNIPLGVDVDKFTPLNRLKYRNLIRNQYNLKETDFVIAFPANEFKRKGLWQIIEVVNTMKTDNIYVFVLGKDDPMPYLEKLHEIGLDNKFIFTGATPIIDQYFAASDMMILPTSYEPFGLVVLEAMASGLPVIVSQTAGVSELIQNNVDGLLLSNPDDTNEISQKLKFMIENATKRTQLGEQARAKALLFTWDNVAEKTYNVYKEIVSQKEVKNVHTQN